MAVVLLCSTGLAVAQDAPRRGPMLQRLDEAIKTLDLPAEQQEQVNAVLDEAATRFNALRQNATGDIRAQAQQIARETRQRVNALLTPEQREKLRAHLTGNLPEPQPEAPAAPVPPPKPAEREAKPASLAVGAPAPGFRLQRIDGRAVSLDNYRGKPTVLLFGSYSSPSFREKAPLFERLKKDFRGKANFVVIYTREAHAANEWPVQRNLDEEVRVELTATLDERKKLAKLAQDSLGLSMEMLVDDMDDAVATIYEAMPNGVAVIDRQGTLVGRLKWAEPYAVRAMLEATLAGK